MKKIAVLLMTMMSISLASFAIANQAVVDNTLLVAQRGCCSHHGGVSGCDYNGRVICNDGTKSPSCGC